MLHKKFVQQQNAYMLHVITFFRLHDEKSKVIEKLKSNTSKSYFEAIHHRNEFATEFKRLDVQIGSLGFVGVI